jgi:hypothetical protein
MLLVTLHVASNATSANIEARLLLETSTTMVKGLRIIMAIRQWLFAQILPMARNTMDLALSQIWHLFALGHRGHFSTDNA